MKQKLKEIWCWIVGHKLIDVSTPFEFAEYCSRCGKYFKH